MAKKKGNDGWWIAGLVIGGLGLLYYLQTGIGKENDSLLIPNTFDGKIHSLIAVLNSRFGKRWVDFGVSVLKYSLQKTLPASLVGLVGIVAAVENMSEHSWMSSHDKQQLAVQMAQAR